MSKRIIKTPIKKVSKDVIEQQSGSGDFRNYLNTFEFEIPELPGSNLKLKIKPLTTLQIKNLLMYEGSEDDYALMTQIFDDIINQSVVSVDFDLTELYLQDRFALLLEIRKKTKGSVHQFDYTCPKCNSQSMQKINLDALPIKKIPDIDHTIKLTDDISIEIDFIKRKNEFEAVEALKILKEKKDMSELEEQVEFALLLEASGIQNVTIPEGTQTNLTLFDKKYLIENIPKIYHQKIKDWYENNEWGVDFTINIKCNHCEFVSENVDVKYDNFFF